jgi:hypothetical protein
MQQQQQQQQQLGSSTVDLLTSSFAPTSSSAPLPQAEIMKVEQGSKHSNGMRSSGAPAFAVDALAKKGEMTFRPFRSSSSSARPVTAYDDDPALPIATSAAAAVPTGSSSVESRPTMHDTFDWTTTTTMTQSTNPSQLPSPPTPSLSNAHLPPASRQRRQPPTEPGNGSKSISSANAGETANAAGEATVSDTGGALGTMAPAAGAANHDVADPIGMTSMYGSTTAMGTGLGGIMGGAGYNSYGNYGAAGAGGLMGSYYGGGAAGGLLGGGMGGYGGGGGMMYPPIMSPYMSSGPLSSLNQFLFGVQSVIFSLGQAVAILSANASAIQQLLDAAMAMFDHAVATWHELKLLEQRKDGANHDTEEESEEDKKRRRRLKALRYALVTAASYAGYRVLRRALSSAAANRQRAAANHHPYSHALTASSASLPVAAPLPQPSQYPYGASSYPQQQPYQPYYSPY